MNAKSKVTCSARAIFLDDEAEGSAMTNYEALLLKPMLRIDEAAILLDVTPRTVNRYLETGKLAPIVMPGGR